MRGWWISIACILGAGCGGVEVGSSAPPLVALTNLGAADGLGGNIIDVSVDEAGDLFAVAPDSLYALRPTETRFTRYTAADGLHITPFVDPAGTPTKSYLSAVAGGAAGEVFVGYRGFDSADPFADTEAERELGNADKVILTPSGLSITRYLFRCDVEHAKCWEDRSVRRMLYAHDGVAAGHLFVGFNHGVSHVLDDTWGDHVHVEVWYHYPDGHVTEKIGEWYGLAIQANGELWTAGRYGAGSQRWYPDPKTWVRGHFHYSFTTYTADHKLDVPAGYREDERGVSVAPDGTVWLASSRFGVSSWPSATSHGDYASIKHWTIAGVAHALDVIADLDNTLWLISGSGALIHFDPATSTATPLSGVSGARRLYLDTMQSPRVLYVATSSGVAVVRP
jgi:hypothetical protein